MDKKLALHKVMTLIAALAIGSASIASDALARGGGGGGGGVAVVLAAGVAAWVVVATEEEVSLVAMP
jgi:hypothetical protein